MTKKRKIRKIRPNKKEEPRIIILTVIVCAVICILYSLLADRVIVSLIPELGMTSFSRQYARDYLERYEGSAYNENEGPPKIFESWDDITLVYYGAINDKSSNINEVFGLTGADGYKTDLLRYGVSTWIADRETKELIGGSTSDLVIIGDDRTRLPADIRATYSDEEYHRLCEFFEVSPAYIDNVSFYYTDNFPYVEKYVLRDGIAYPLVISFHEEGNENTYFYADKEFDYAAEEVIEADDCRMHDDPADPLDATYQLAVNLSEGQYDLFLRRNYIPYELTYISGNRICNVIMATTDKHILCLAEVTDYSGILKISVTTGCLIIILICGLTAFILCRKAKRKRDKAEYERSVTNALAHNYKSSLMVVRGCAENLIAGVSEEKKAKYEQKIMDETDKMNESTEKILSFYRTGAAGYEPVSESIDASESCKEIITKYESVSVDKKLQWIINDSEKYTLKGDPVLFKMALDNLIGNAVKYALPESAITVTTYKGGMSLTNKWKPIDKFIKKPKLFFEAFVTGDDTPGRSNSGLGLSITKDLLTRMGLKVSAKPSNENVIFEIRNK